MCGYACTNCGRCRGEAPRYLTSLEDVPGYCAACETLNGPTSSTCKNCGAALGRTKIDSNQTVTEPSQEDLR